MQKVQIRAIEKLDFRTKEAYKTLRTNLSFSGQNIKVVGMTSCTPSEGKTSVSFQLALSMAESGKKTILVDADMRKSVLRGRYKANHEKFGLSHFLSGQTNLNECVCETNVENFHIIFAGPVPPNPSELLSGNVFRGMVEKLRKEYDYVIIDTPPLGSVIDGAVIASNCDGAVLIIESGAISYKFAQNVKGQLEKAGCRILGCVLNKVNMSGRGYYGKYYEKYYGSYYGQYYGSGEEEDWLTGEKEKTISADAPAPSEKAAQAPINPDDINQMSNRSAESAETEQKAAEELEDDFDLL